MNKYKNIISELQKRTETLRDHNYTINGWNLDRFQTQESLIDDGDVLDYFQEDDCILELIIFLFENKERYSEVYEDFTETPYKKDFIVECDGLMKDCLAQAFDYVLIEE